MPLPTKSIRGFALIACALIATFTLAGPPAAHAVESERYVAPTFDVAVTHDLVYGAAPVIGGTEPLLLDLYQPAGDTAAQRPAIVFAHGGAFTQGDKADWYWLPLLNGLASRGYVIASINFRLDGSQQHATADTRAAVRWFRANASLYGIDTSKIIAMGSSSGGLQALTVNFAPEFPGTSGNPGYPSNVAGAVAVSFGVLQHIDSGEPPIAIFQATDDDVALGLSESSCAMTMARGNVCEMYRYRVGGHGKDLLLAHPQQVMQQMSSFLCRQVLGPTMCSAPPPTLPTGENFPGMMPN
jgi:dienelactone hydrolase